MCNATLLVFQWVHINCTVGYDIIGLITCSRLNWDTVCLCVVTMNPVAEAETVAVAVTTSIHRRPTDLASLDLVTYTFAAINPDLPCAST